MAKEPGVGNKAAEGLQHAEGQQLSIGQLGTDAHRRPPSSQSGVDLERVIDLHVQCGSKGVQVGVHEASKVERWCATPIMDALCASARILH